ncbi:MAG: hypothetical protein ACI4I7_05840 [Oscillospiraceae bacterium]
MSTTKIKTYTVKPKGGKSYLKDIDKDLALGFIKKSVFVNTSEDSFQKSFEQVSYENEIHCFVSHLLDDLSFLTDEDDEISQYVFEDEENFDIKHLLWACFDMLIKADLTIGEIKRQRMELLREIKMRDFK